MKQNIPFKTYSPNQTQLFSSDLCEKIPQSHPVRVVDKIIDQIDLTPLYLEYNSVGASSYHPAMLLKVIIYAYLQNIYSSRKIEEALLEQVPFIWISAESYPDHNTIARFRSSKLKKHIKTIFSQIVQLLAKEGFINIEEAYVDGTKIEANANKYTFVWKKSIQYNKKRISTQLEELWKYAEAQNKQELRNTREIDFSNLDADKIKSVIDDIDTALKDNVEVDPRVKKN